MTSVLYGACLICAFGFISLATGIDVIPRSSAPGLVETMVGPTMAAIAIVIVFLAVLLALTPQPVTASWLRAIACAAAVYLLPPLAAAAAVAFADASAFVGLLFFVARVGGPFMPAAAALAGLVVFVTPPLARRTHPR